MEHDFGSAQNSIAPKNRLAAALILFGVASLLSIGIGIAAQIDNLKGIGSFFALIYILLLIWWLATIPPHAGEKPDFSPLVNLPRSYGIMLGFISILAALAFVWAGILRNNGWLMFPLSTVVAVAILMLLHKQIDRKVILAGSIIAAALFIVEFIFQFRNPKGGIFNSLLLALLLAFQAAAGILLLNHSKLTKFQLYEGNIFKAIQSLGWGCMLAIPPALLNIASLTNSYLSASDRQFDQWWKAFYALQPGILEETWARLFLLTLFYALLRPTTLQKPQRALTAALVVSVLIHGLAHFPQSMSDPISVIFGALMYGIPLGLIYIKRDFESAVAYHFFLDFIRFAFTASLIN